MRPGTLFLVTALFLCLVGCSGGSGEKAVLLRLKAKPGDSMTVTYRVDTLYDLPGDGKGGGPNQQASFLELKKLYTCKEATEEKLVWEVKTVDVKADGTGPMQAQSLSIIEAERDKFETVERSPQNKLLSKTKDHPMELLYPDSELRVGDSWRGEMSLQGATLMMTYTAEAFEPVGGKQTVRIRGELDGSFQVRMEKPLFVWIDQATGLPVKGSGIFLLEPQGGVRVRMEVKMNAE